MGSRSGSGKSRAAGKGEGHGALSVDSMVGSRVPDVHPHWGNNRELWMPFAAPAGGPMTQ